jgi:hypothetical protein
MKRTKQQRLEALAKLPKKTEAEKQWEQTEAAERAKAAEEQAALAEKVARSEQKKKGAATREKNKREAWENAKTEVVKMLKARRDSLSKD